MDQELDDKRLPFEVPDGYFEDFAARMDARIAEEMKATQAVEQPKGRRIDLRRWVAMVSSSAAVLVGLVFGGYTLMNMQQQVDAQAEEILAQETYVEEMLEMLDLHQIEFALADAELLNEDE